MLATPVQLYRALCRGICHALFTCGTVLQHVHAPQFRGLSQVEPDRWYYHADRLGLLVWQDMPSMCGANEDTWYADCWVKNRSISEVGPPQPRPACFP